MQIATEKMPLMSTKELTMVANLIDMAIENKPNHSDIALWKETVRLIDLELDSRE